MKKILAIFIALLFASNAFAASGKVTVVTSFPKDLSGKFKEAFEKKYSGVTVEVVGKKTTAGIKYIQETKSNNGTDLFWASAPDAFEVLKGDGLLEKYTSATKGIPAKVGSYPVNDPDGFYTGFAAAGYGMMWNTRYLKANKLPEPKEWIDL
jgi:phosphoglycerate transport regulatory protein PgtC